MPIPRSPDRSPFPSCRSLGARRVVVIGALAIPSLLLLTGCAQFRMHDSRGYSVATGAPHRAPDLLAATVAALHARIPDLRFERAYLDDVRARFEAAPDAAERRRIVRALLARVPTSHLALFSEAAKEYFERELRGEPNPTLGFSIARIADEFVITGVLRGTPAADAGLVRGDRLLSIDGVAVAESARLEPRHDDAAVPPGSRVDPEAEAAHLLRVEDGERVAIEVRRGGRGSPTTFAVTLPVVRATSLGSDRAGVRVVTVAVPAEDPSSEGGTLAEGAATTVSVGILPFSYIYSRGSSNHFADALTGPLAEVDALVLDLRGRGGSGLALMILTSYLQREIYTRGMPIVATIDRRTRSAKEVLAQRLQRGGLGVLVGERTPGAVRASGWVELVDEEWLLCPHGAIGRDPRGLEGIGVAPDIAVTDPFPEGDGSDPILDRAIAEAAARAVRAIDVTSGRGSPGPTGRRARD